MGFKVKIRKVFSPYTLLVAKSNKSTLFERAVSSPGVALKASLPKDPPAGPDN